MKGLTKREKFLLSVLGILVVITVYVVFLFLPTLENYMSNKTLYSNLQVSHEELDMKVARYGNNDKLLKDAKEVADEQTKLLLPTRENDQLQGYLLEIAHSQGLDIVAVNITGDTINVVYPDMQEVEEPAEGEKTTYNIKDNLYLIKGITDPIQAAPALYETYLEKNTVDISFNSTNEQLQTFLDAVYNQGKTMRVSGIAVDKEGVFTVSIVVYSSKGLEWEVWKRKAKKVSF